MRSQISKTIVVGLFFIQSIYSKNIITKDTLSVQLGKTSYRLTNNFIYPESVKIISSDLSTGLDSIDYINGIIYWNHNHEEPVDIIITYSAIIKDLPLSVGPGWKSLPTIDSILVNKPKLNHYLKNEKVFQNDNLYTSGTFNRQLNLSTQGMSEFSGGLHLNLSGELDENIMLSAVLSDQDILLQPEGNTRNLEDIDQVYIALQHPKFTLDAGDISYNKNFGKLINIDRKVVGLNYNFDNKKVRGNTLIGSTRGRYMSKDIIGVDGVQGPYRLRSNLGSKDISIISASEKVWVDGQLMIRGANYDYVIDYSLAEITFTAKRLIHSDIDIFVEYEYVDGQYSQNIISGLYSSSISKNFKLITGVIREGDKTDNLPEESELYQKISGNNTSDLIINGAVEDSIGDYYFDSEIYCYDPGFINAHYKRYRVTFTYDSNGEYEKKVSTNGKVYYQYYENGNYTGSKDLYSPYQKISTPRSKDLLYTEGRLQLGNKLFLSGFFSRSRLDNNTLSELDNYENGGLYNLSFKIDSMKVGRVTYFISGSDQQRQKNYSSFGLDRDVRFKRFWDIDDIDKHDERESSLKFSADIENFSFSSFEFSKLNKGSIEKERFKIDQEINSGIASGTKLKHQQISSLLGKYKYTDAILRMETKYFLPFVRFQEEERPDSVNYKIIGSGIDFQNNQKIIKLGIDKREDNYNNLLGPNLIDNHSEDLISSFQYINQNRSGLRSDIVLKRRIKNIDESINNLDYVLGRIKLSYKKADSPTQFEMSFSTEQTQNENYSIVYDSVGVGLGDYRYDNDFNTFIRDPNGAFISYSVSTGDRVNMTNVNGFQRIIIDLQKLRGYPNFRLRVDTNFDYSGKKFNLYDFIDPGVLDTAVFRSYLHNLIELDWKQNRTMDRIRNYHIISYDFQGYDPRGSELFKHLESGIDYYSSISKYINYKLSGYYHHKDIESSFIENRNRIVYGSWYDAILYLNNKQNINSEFTIKYGADRGNFYLDRFNVYGIGIEYNARLYLDDRGSLHATALWQENREISNMKILPPEALNGLTVGKNINVNTRINYFINSDISLSISFSYLDNSRYKNLVTVLGEFRAYL